MTHPKAIPSQSPLRLRIRERRILLVFGDILMGVIALLIALLFWSSADVARSFSMDFLRRTPGWFFLLPLVWPILMLWLYEDHRARSMEMTLRGIGLAAGLGLGLYLLLYFTSEPNSLPRLGVAIFIIAVSILSLIWRLSYIRIFTAPQFLRRVLLVGAGETGKIMLRIIGEMNPKPFILAGIIDDDPDKIGSQIDGLEVFGGGDILLETIHKHSITDLIVAISGRMNGSMFQALLDAQETGIDITRMPVAYEELLNRVPIRYLEADWILRSFVDQTRVNTLYEMTKRLLDILGGLIGLAVLLFILPMVSLATLVDSGLPIFYTQTRLGRAGQSYKIYKFRTMRQNAEPDGQPRWAEENDQRATAVGRVLRKTHLDEIPQVINVLRGEMSLVGPRAERPELVAWFQQHVPFYRARLLVRPGITGWAQVNQEYAATIDETIEKLEYDLYYIKHRSLIMDLRVIMRTPMMVLGLRGR
ncbi:MAG: sugar transferase [Anaerolineales bacterium]|nr:sugar transferase [Anaerolineales bacterium]